MMIPQMMTGQSASLDTEITTEGFLQYYISWASAEATLVKRKMEATW